MRLIRYVPLALLTFATLAARADQAALDQLERELRVDAGRAVAVDANGDTPLGRALKANDHDRAKLLVRYSGFRNLRHHRNAARETYVFLAAQAGFADIIGDLAQEYYQSLGGLRRFDFAKLDRPDLLGRRALFVAGNRAVVEALEVQHWRGFVKGPWWDFMLARDKRGQNFVHAAARDGREDVIAYAVERACASTEWENSKRWFKKYPAWAGEHGISMAQTYVTGDLGLPFDRLVNRRDVGGQTPLHVAVEARQWGALRALAHCRWTDYDLADAKGDLPIHTFLKALGPNERKFADDVHEAFAFLIAQSTTLRLNTPTTRARRKNRDGNTPLHLAAKLADPYFYEQLARFGDVFALDAGGNIPERLYEERRRDPGVTAH